MTNPNAKVNPELQEQISPVYNPANFIPFGEAEGLTSGAIRGIAAHMGVDLANQTERGIFENALRQAASSTLKGTAKVAGGVAKAGEFAESILPTIASKMTD